MISIVLIHDQKLIGESWNYILGDQNSFVVKGQACDALSGINIVEDNKPDIIIAGLNINRTETLRVMEILQKASVKSKMILVSAGPDLPFIQKALYCGVKGFLTTASSLDELVIAVKTVFEGKLYIAEVIRKCLAMNEDGTLHQNQDLEALTPREQQIVRLVATGMTSNEIAAHLNIAGKTVEVHRYHIFKKLSVKNVSSLVNFVTSNRI